jgi:uncharacterized protein involved in type VI secretion and phage assembly
MKTMPSIWADVAGARYFGVYPAIVTDIVDKDSLGRIQVKFPWLGADGANVRAWATLCSPYADDDQGLEVLPAKDTQVVVVFEGGMLRRPYIIGSTWNGVEKMPENPAQPNNIRVLKSRAKSKLEFDDTSGSAKVTISMQSGHKVVLDDQQKQVVVHHANGCEITLTATQIKVDANVSVDITAPTLNVHCASSMFDGTITCTTLTAETSVVSPSYTTGAGNIL